MRAILLAMGLLLVASSGLAAASPPQVAVASLPAAASADTCVYLLPNLLPPSVNPLLCVRAVT